MDDKERYSQEAHLDVIRQQMSAYRIERIETVARQRQRGLTIVMENVQNVHNLAAISRTADAFGIQTVHYTDALKDDSFNNSDIEKTSRSANKWVDFEYHKNIYTCLTTLQAEGWHIVATVASEKAKPLYNVNWTQHKKLAILIGNEHNGLSAEAEQLADMYITIPMRGMMQSFNVSVATAISLSEITRQRDKSTQDFRIPEADAQHLIDSFLRRALF